MNSTKELTLIHRETLEVISKIIKISSQEWHNMIKGELIEKLTTEEVYQLIYCSKKDLFYICGSL